MLHIDGLNTRGYVTSRKVASRMVITGVVHFVSQKEMKHMAMHVCDMPSQCDGLIFINVDEYYIVRSERHRPSQIKVYFGS